MTPSRAPGRPLVVTVIACIAALLTTMLPWLRTGAARRSAFPLARSADALGFIDTPVRRALIVSWYLLPFLTALTWTAAALGRPVAVAALGSLIGAMSIAAGVVVISLVRPEPGPVASVAAGSVVTGSALWLWLAIRGADTTKIGNGREIP